MTLSKEESLIVLRFLRLVLLHIERGEGVTLDQISFAFGLLANDHNTGTRVGFVSVEIVEAIFEVLEEFVSEEDIRLFKDRLRHVARKQPGEGNDRRRVVKPWEQTWKYNKTWCTVDRIDEIASGAPLVSERLDQAAGQLMATAPKLYRALEAAQWCQTHLGSLCPTCERPDHAGHASDCMIDLALREARGEL